MLIPGSDPEEEEEERDEIEYLRAALQAATTENESLKSQVSSLNVVKKEKARAKEMWRANCEYLAEHDELIAAKDAEIELLKGQLATANQQRQEQAPSKLSHPPVEPQLPQPDRRQCRGKAPPVDRSQEKITRSS